MIWLWAIGGVLAGIVATLVGVAIWLVRLGREYFNNGSKET